MAIAKISKLNLIAMSYDKDKLLNALQKTNAVEVKLHKEEENTSVPIVNADFLATEKSSFEAALSILISEVETYEKSNSLQSELPKDGFDVGYSEFMSIKEERERLLTVCEQVNNLFDEKNKLKTLLQKQKKETENLSVYSLLKTPFSSFSDTQHVKIRLGTIIESVKEEMCLALNGIELSSYEEFSQVDNTVLLCVVYHKDVCRETEEVLSRFGFSDCTEKGEATGEERFKDAQRSLNETEELLTKNAENLYALRSEVKNIKIYCDYLAFCLEKEELSDKLRKTETTFLLEAYVPEEAIEDIKAEIQKVSPVVYMEFSEVSEEDTPPTLLKNNWLVENFEGITNTYSAPNYREFDPNTVMAFFYSLFMGFIIGDSGYGVLMLLLGGALWYKNRIRPTGMSRLAAVFAVGGIFALIWGGLFNSFFGVKILPITVMPDPQSSRWSLVGIEVPSVLVIALEVGVSQLFAGYICKAVQEWRRGSFWDGFFDGVIWAIFSIGVGLAIVGFVDQANLPILGTIGAIIAGGSLLIAILTAGRHEKLFGKFTKGFGTAYGIINYASDILSYARLYGLMLSGAVIAGIVSTYGGQFVASGNILLILLGLVLFVVGHGFNLVMNLLGAYIHDARLQYVEFYGRFFEGEGELFAPLGSRQQYITLLRDKN